jgi:hypothetical protein
MNPCSKEKKRRRRRRRRRKRGDLKKTRLVALTCLEQPSK